MIMIQEHRMLVPCNWRGNMLAAKQEVKRIFGILFTLDGDDKSNALQHKLLLRVTHTFTIRH
jgi:hypothetical protein